MVFMDSQFFAYEKKENSAAILRCFSRDGRIRIPEKIGGLEVRELAPYAFSAHLDERVLDNAACEGRLRICMRSDLTGQTETVAEGILPELPALCGDRLEELMLPLSMRRVGRYCFYNCSKLRRLEFPGKLYDWGSGAFTGCHRAGELCVHLEPDGDSGLKQVLDELPEELQVELCMETQEHAAPQYARLLFPEFYEEGVENTPARILETHVHGSGILYRNCFQGKRFDFEQYDTLFPHALAQENTRLLTELVLGRLRFPYRLERQAQEEYETYVRGHALMFGNYFLDKKDPEGLLWFLERFGAEQVLLDELSGYAAKAGDAQAQSLLMNYRREKISTPARRKRLEL